MSSKRVAPRTRHWVWSFGNRAGLDWVTSNAAMAFADHAEEKMGLMDRGDQAVLYMTGTATGSRARIVGLAEVRTAPHVATPPIEIAAREYPFVCQVRVGIILSLGIAPIVEELADELDVVDKTHAYWNYFMPSPVEITLHDYDLMARAIHNVSDCETGT